MRRPNLHAGLHQALGRWYLCLALSSGSARRASFWPPHSDFANHHQRPRLSSGLRPAQDEGERSQRGLGRAHADGAARAAQAAGHGAAGCRGGLGQLRGGVGLPQPTARRSRRTRCHTTGGTSSRPAGLPKLRLHDLRHTHVTLALAAGVHPKVVQERLGHSTVAFTLDVYSHAVPALQEEAAERVAALFAE